MDVIVTYFYEQEIKGYNRTKDEYIKRFSIWASNLYNEMIIFVQKENEDIVKNIRKKYIDKTRVVIIDDNVYNKYEKYNDLIRFNLLNSDYKSNILRPFHQHTTFEYCAIWMLKVHFIYEASKILNEKDKIVYIDFGLTELKYFKGDFSSFDKKLSFDQFDEKKIHLFKYNKNDLDIPMFLYFESSIGFIYACSIIIPCSLVKCFYKLYFEAMYACLLVGFNPVDQDVLYLLQRNNKSLFNLIELNENTQNVLAIVFNIAISNEYRFSFKHTLKRIYIYFKSMILIRIYLYKKFKKLKRIVIYRD